MFIDKYCELSIVVKLVKVHVSGGSRKLPKSGPETNLQITK